MQILLGLSRMSPTDLGFDPTMKLYQGNIDSCIPSYLISNATISKGYEPLKWVFSMPTEDGSGREDFITIRSLSVNRAEVVRGRATRLWVVCKLSDILNPSSSETQVCLFITQYLFSGVLVLIRGAIALCVEIHVAGYQTRPRRPDVQR